MKKNIASVHLVLRVSIFAWTLIINLWTTMVLTDYARTRELLTLFISQKCVCLFWAGTFLYFRMTWISFYLLNMLCRSTCVWLTLPLTWPKLSPSTKGHLGRLLLTCLRRSCNTADKTMTNLPCSTWATTPLSWQTCANMLCWCTWKPQTSSSQPNPEPEHDFSWMRTAYALPVPCKSLI